MAEKIKVTKNDLIKEGSGTIGIGITTDKIVNYYGWGDSEKPLKFVVCKGYINDWCIYLEAMDREQDYEQVKDVGNKIHNEEKIKLLVDCSDEVLERYRK